MSSSVKIMKPMIGIDQVNSMAFRSVNRLTNTIKSTLSKGNNLIRSELNPMRSSQNISIKPNTLPKQILPVDEELNAHRLYQKVKPYVANNQKVKKNIINLLNFAEIKWREFCDLPAKSVHQYNEYLQKFKKIDHKLNTNLNHLTDQDNKDDLHAIQVQFKRIIEYLNQRARKYIDKNKQIINLIKNKDKQQFEQECHEQAVKQEMLDLLDRLKGQAINMSSDLKKDNIVIAQINQKQDRQLNTLSGKSKIIKEIMNDSQMGFFKLLSYAGIGIVVWLFTLLFILMF